MTNLIYKNIDDVGKRNHFLTSLPIVGDEEGLSLTSYQSASEHITKRIKSKLGKVSTLELCSGVGGITIFLAKKLAHIFAIDINPIRIQAAKQNAKTFNVLNKITFIEGDILDEKLLSSLKDNNKIEAVVTDVDWRDDLTKSLKETTPDISKTIPSTPIIFEKINRLITSNIIMHLAANTNKNQLYQLGPCEIEELKYNGVVKFINVYFGNLINSNGITSFEMNN